MDNLFTFRLFLFVFFVICSSPAFLSACDEFNGTPNERPISAPYSDQQQIELDSPKANSRKVREAGGTENAGNATADAGSVGNGTADEAMSTTIDWWSSLATQSPLVVQRDSANASVSNSSASVPIASAASSPNATSPNSPDNSTATAKNSAIQRPFLLFTVLVAFGAMATIL
ncbi:hypothetical protein niasHT_013482 [Heterodera trifolii]|uniref:Uncharacterized protein n=1 Tax=Heterodera trifolii TaxID=157864 RepID=A0ABD2LCQ9_9BILA